MKISLSSLYVIGTIRRLPFSRHSLDAVDRNSSFRNVADFQPLPLSGEQLFSHTTMIQTNESYTTPSRFHVAYKSPYHITASRNLPFPHPVPSPINSILFQLSLQFTDSITWNCWQKVECERKLFHSHTVCAREREGQYKFKSKRYSCICVYMWVLTLDVMSQAASRVE